MVSTFVKGNAIHKNSSPPTALVRPTWFLIVRAERLCFQNYPTLCAHLAKIAFSIVPKNVQENCIAATCAGRSATLGGACPVQCRFLSIVDVVEHPRRLFATKDPKNLFNACESVG